MSSILYITPDFYQSQKFAGGMGTKTSAIQEAWSLYFTVDVASDLNLDVVDLYDFIIIELLGFRNDGKLSDRIKSLKASRAPKLVYGSDSEIFRWTGEEREALSEVVTLWIPNTEWQGNYFRDFDLPVSPIVHEPINTDVFRPGASVEQVVIAGGAVSYEKQSDFFVGLFAALRSKPYQTVYVGDAGLWGHYSANNLVLEKQLRDVTDTFYGSVPTAQVASVLGTSAVAVLNPYYETCNRFHQELMASGVPVVAGPHILYNERLVQGRFSDVDTCIEQLAEVTNGWEYPDVAHRDASREYAVSRWSYEASVDQLHEVLRRL